MDIRVVVADHVVVAQDLESVLLLGHWFTTEPVLY